MKVKAGQKVAVVLTDHALHIMAQIAGRMARERAAKEAREPEATQTQRAS